MKFFEFFEVLLENSNLLKKRPLKNVDFMKVGSAEWIKQFWINIPKKIITCLIILVIVLVILYFTGFINKEKIPMPFEHYSNSEEAKGLDDFTDTLNLKI